MDMAEALHHRTKNLNKDTIKKLQDELLAVNPWGTTIARLPSARTVNLQDQAQQHQTRVTPSQFYTNRIQVHDDFSALHLSRLLFQQYFANAFTKIEGNDLNYIRSHQKDLRVESYKSLMDPKLPRCHNHFQKTQQARHIPHIYGESKLARRLGKFATQPEATRPTRHCCARLSLEIQRTAEIRQKTAQLQQHRVNDSWVVPHNIKLLLKFDCHINVEVCTTIKSVKYIFKYIHKGNDMAHVEIRDGHEEADLQRNIVHDAIQHYLNYRYLSPHQTVYKLMQYEMYNKSHTIVRLAIHLPDQHAVFFTDPEQAVHRNNDSTLKVYFTLNQREEHAFRYLYQDRTEH
eukprot:gene10460-biopygen7627